MNKAIWLHAQGAKNFADHIDKVFLEQKSLHKWSVKCLPLDSFFKCLKLKFFIFLLFFQYQSALFASIYTHIHAFTCGYTPKCIKCMFSDPVFFSFWLQTWRQPWLRTCVHSLIDKNTHELRSIQKKCFEDYFLCPCALGLSFCYTYGHLHIYMCISKHHLMIFPPARSCIYPG